MENRNESCISCVHYDKNGSCTCRDDCIEFDEWILDEDDIHKLPHMDTQRFDALQKTSTGYGRGWILRESINGRGMRLHETTISEAKPTIREAIDDYFAKNNDN